MRLIPQTPTELLRLGAVTLLLAAAFAVAPPYLKALANPPTGDRLLQVVEGPLSAEPLRKNTTGLGTTIDDALDTDLTSAQQRDGVSQLIVVTNLSSANRVCVGSVAFSGSGADCAAKLAVAGNWATATVMNCTANSAHMGSVVPAGQSRVFRYDGTRCVGIVGSAASSEVQVERVLR